MRPHDEDAWMVPKEGTLMRLVYGLAKQGFTTRQIADTLNKDVGMVSVMVHRIKNPSKRSTYPTFKAGDLSKPLK